eukprot:COSAG05_NODE_371_length_10705_cov_99.051475_5_plen_97_part_00
MDGVNEGEAKVNANEVRALVSHLLLVLQALPLRLRLLQGQALRLLHRPSGLRLYSRRSTQHQVSHQKARQLKNSPETARTYTETETDKERERQTNI